MDFKNGSSAMFSTGMFGLKPWKNGWKPRDEKFADWQSNKRNWAIAKTSGWPFKKPSGEPHWDSQMMDSILDLDRTTTGTVTKIPPLQWKWTLYQLKEPNRMGLISNASLQRS